MVERKPIKRETPPTPEQAKSMTFDQVVDHLNREADKWAAAYGGVDPEIGRKVSAFLQHGDYRHLMSTRLIEARELFLEHLEIQQNASD